MRKENRNVLIALSLLFSAMVAFGFYALNRVLKVERTGLAIQNLRSIHSAEEQFKSLHGRYGTLEELAKASLLPSHLSGDRKELKYHYWISDLSPTTFCTHADRKTKGTAYKDSNISEDGALHWIESEITGSVPRGLGKTDRDE